MLDHVQQILVARLPIQGADEAELGLTEVARLRVNVTGGGAIAVPLFTVAGRARVEEDPLPDWDRELDPRRVGRFLYGRSGGRSGVAIAREERDREDTTDKAKSRQLDRVQAGRT
jgi:hypothetical protein